MTIAITGATGQLGRLAIAAARARGASPIALVRSPEKAADLGVETRAFDYDKADHAALNGVDTLVLISANEVGKRFAQHKAVIDAAKAAGVKRIIYTSLLKGDASPMKLAAEHVETEAALKESGIAYTILRNGWYTENLTGALAPAIEHGAIIGSAGDGRYSAAARADYAEAIAVTAIEAGHENKVYELAGDTGFTGAELAAEVARQAAKPVAYVNLPEADYAKALEGFGLPAGFAAILADSDAQTAKGALFDDSKTLSRLIGHPTTPLTATVAAALA
ncbi:SDR family oxidoreductase [Pseudomonas sp. GX19020]|uniref:SDR family oxidoreductase n=1 Tax=Pseudomonas sp. GX19020 TaxID=2942277 RepID=UPI00201866EC|nr:SDR family oxidoreductase [Pseudomonas sp. GX19020]MCL4066712.1 SDR family oxidoreductase [Pseudomonas sp. GX19020]